MSETMKFVLMMVVIGILSYIVSTFFFQICIVKGSSMEPTLKNNNILIAKKFNLNIERNDIAVIKKNNLLIIKRVVAVPNDRIKLVDGYVYVNDKMIDTIYTEYAGILDNEITLKDEEYFIMGDNRQNSTDSRHQEIGIIKRPEIIGLKILEN